MVADADNDEVVKQVSADGPREVVTDKGYHSRAVVSELTEWGVRTYCSEPNRGRQRWSEQEREQQAVYANRRRIRGERGLRLLRQRGEKLERWNQHLYDRGGMRRLHLRGRENILKRLVVHSGAANLGLLMRKLFGKGTPRGLAGAFSAIISAADASTRPWSMPATLIRKIGDSVARAKSGSNDFPPQRENSPFHLALLVSFHETATVVNKNLFLLSPTSTQASIRILMSHHVPGSMQGGFRVKSPALPSVSRALTGSRTLTQSPGTYGFFTTLPPPRNLRPS